MQAEGSLEHAEKELTRGLRAVEGVHRDRRCNEAGALLLNAAEDGLQRSGQGRYVGGSVGMLSAAGSGYRIQVSKTGRQTVTETDHISRHVLIAGQAGRLIFGVQKFRQIVHANTAPARPAAVMEGLDWIR